MKFRKWEHQNAIGLLQWVRICFIHPSIYPSIPTWDHCYPRHNLTLDPMGWPSSGNDIFRIRSRVTELPSTCYATDDMACVEAVQTATWNTWQPRGLTRGGQGAPGTLFITLLCTPSFRLLPLYFLSTRGYYCLFLSFWSFSTVWRFDS